MRRCWVKTIASSQFDFGCLRITLYAEGTRITINIRLIVLYWGVVPIMMGRVILPSTLTESPEKLAKRIEILFS